MIHAIDWPHTFYQATAARRTVYVRMGVYSLSSITAEERNNLVDCKTRIVELLHSFVGPQHHTLCTPKRRVQLFWVEESGVIHQLQLVPSSRPHTISVIRPISISQGDIHIASTSGRLA